MGSSKTYTDSIDRRTGVRADQCVMRDSKPESLSAKKLEPSTEPHTRTPAPTPVTAWVRYGTTDHHAPPFRQTPASTGRSWLRRSGGRFGGA